MKKTRTRIYILTKRVKATSAEEAIKLSKTVDWESVEPFKRDLSGRQLPSAIGFRIDNDEPEYADEDED